MSCLKKCSLFSLIFRVCLLTGVIMIVVYFVKFHGSLSGNPQDWSAFGCYFGGIAGLIAFAGVLLSLDKSEKNQKDNSERSYFFELTTLHRAKFEGVEFIESNTSYTGAEAFKKYANQADLYFQHLCFYKYIIQRFDNEDEAKIVNDFYVGNLDVISSILDEVKKSIEKEISSNINTLGWSNKKIMEELKVVLGKKKIPLIQQNLTSKVEAIIQSIPQEEKLNIFLEYMREVSDAIYDKFGHVLGHYFRNNFYAMRIIDGFDGGSSNDFKQLFRAQISRYEIALGLYNALSSKSSVNMIALLKKYDIFKDLYQKDIYIFSVLGSTSYLSDFLDKHSNKLNELGRI